MDGTQSTRRVHLLSSSLHYRIRSECTYLVIIARSRAAVGGRRSAFTQARWEEEVVLVVPRMAQI